MFSHSAAEAQEMGLVNAVVPEAELDATVAEWCRELAARSPTAIAIAKRSFNADTESIRGIGNLGFQGLALYYGTEESQEGVAALSEAVGLSCAWILASSPVINRAPRLNVM